MDIAKKLIDAVIGVEGGYSNHPADKGGPTRWGITEQVARAYGYGGPMSRLPREIAVEIYRKRYFVETGLDRVAAVAPRLAAELFDTCVNMGSSIPGRFLQRGLNAFNRRGRDYPDLEVDGRIASLTIARLTAFLQLRGSLGETVLIRACDAQQGARYLEICEGRDANEEFAFGWFAHRVGETHR
jgi:lysozyme family protein